MIGQYVLVRTYSAGVHCGVLKEAHGTCVVLAEASRVWRWKGANSCHELALRGPSMDYTRISEQAQLVMLTEAIEVHLCTPEAERNLRKTRWGKE